MIHTKRLRERVVQRIGVGAWLSYLGGLSNQEPFLI
jgi:hypothetical protein